MLPEISAVSAPTNKTLPRRSRQSTMRRAPSHRIGKLRDGCWRSQVHGKELTPQTFNALPEFTFLPERRTLTDLQVDLITLCVCSIAEGVKNLENASPPYRFPSGWTEDLSTHYLSGGRHWAVARPAAPVGDR